MDWEYLGARLSRHPEIPEDIHNDFINTFLLDVAAIISVRLTNYCSHGCWYCVDGKPRENSVRSELVDRYGVQNFIDNLLLLSHGKKLEYRLSGGECTESPYFEETLQALLAAGHKIKIFTNGLNAKLVRLLAAYPKDKHDIHLEPSWHIGVYCCDSGDHRLKLHRTNMEQLFSMVRSANVIVPMSPSALKHVAAIEDYFTWIMLLSEQHSVSCYFNPVHMHGTNLDGRHMPQDYTFEERKIYNAFQEKWRKQPGGSRFEVFDNRTRGDDLALIGSKLYLHGARCYYSNLFWVVSAATGLLQHCGSGHPGRFDANIFNRDHAEAISKYFLDKKPMPCSYLFCQCVAKGEPACMAVNGIRAASLVQEQKAREIRA
jgi:sulfatase maturation enzyme AslB (radical SAM superfamily)